MFFLYKDGAILYITLRILLLFLSKPKLYFE
jgi:hypothetical protein